MNLLPLSHVRIVDLTMVWSGPFCTQILADFGAEVIKIESLRHFDPIRGVKHPLPGTPGYPDDEPGPDPWNRTVRYHDRNRNKLSLTIDLTDMRGRMLFKELVSISDIVIENFSAGTMDRLGLGYTVLREIRPDIILLSMPGFGSTGPDRDYVAYGLTIEALSGLGSLTGYGDGLPMKCGVNISDPIAALHAAGALLAALHYRAETGKGQAIELAQLESTLRVLGEALLAYEMTGRTPLTHGNRDPARAPQGCYPCRGEDQWIALSVRTQEEWQGLCTAMGQPELAGDPRFCTREQRFAHHDALDELIATWTAQQTPYQALRHLQRAGVPAGPVLANRDLFADPQVLARDALVMIDHPSIGRRAYPAPAVRLSRTMPRHFRPAPRLGEHNAVILGTLLGLTQEEQDALERDGLIGTEPAVER